VQELEEVIAQFTAGFTAVQLNTLWAVLAVALLAIVYALVLRRQVLRRDAGSEHMQAIAGSIRAGASAYLGQQRNNLLLLGLLLAALLAASVLLLPPTAAAEERFGSEQALLWVALGRAGAFVLAAGCAYLVAASGMQLAIQGTVRVAAAARKGYNPALHVAYTASVVTGLLTGGLGLLGSALIVLLFGLAAPTVLVAFALGAALAALVLRVGGGIYAQAAEVGAQIVQAGGAGNPGDAPVLRTPAGEPLHQPAAVAELVGNNAGDNAGMAAEGFASFTLALVAPLLLGDLLLGGAGDGMYDLRFVLFPLALYGVGLLAALIGNATVRTDETRRNALAALGRSFSVALVLSVIGIAAATYFLLPDPQSSLLGLDWRPGAAALLGVLLALLLRLLARYATATQYAPVKAVSRAGRNGPGSSMIAGLSLGFEASTWAAMLIGAALGGAVLLYATAPAATQLAAMLYGIALTGMGLLMLTGNTLALHGFGPLAGNARDMSDLAELDKNARNVLDDLDAVGSTTSATTASLTIGAGVLATLALFGVFVVLMDGNVPGAELLTAEINIANPLIFIGLLLGSSLPLLFSSLTLRGVLRAAALLVAEVQQQATKTASAPALPLADELPARVPEATAEAEKEPARVRESAADELPASAPEPPASQPQDKPREQPQEQPEGKRLEQPQERPQEKPQSKRLEQPQERPQSKRPEQPQEKPQGKRKKKKGAAAEQPAPAPAEPQIDYSAYTRAVAVVAAAVRRDLLVLTLLALLFTLLVGFVLGIQALAAFLAGSILVGLVLALWQSSAGGAWHNARYYIEEGFLGGKNSEAHRAALVAEQVGSALNDTGGPMLTPLLRLMVLLALLLAPLVVAPGLLQPVLGVAAVCVVVLLWSSWQTRGAGVGSREKSKSKGTRRKRTRRRR
jgi:K(+)-stimulated pyrophosphate-energized sodium pump